MGLLRPTPAVQVYSQCMSEEKKELGRGPGCRKEVGTLAHAPIASPVGKVLVSCNPNSWLGNSAWQVAENMHQWKATGMPAPSAAGWAISPSQQLRMHACAPIASCPAA